MKTFKSKYVGHSHQELNIVRLDDGVRVSVDHGSHGARGIVIAPSDVPALALAEMDAAGYVESEHAGDWPHFNRAMFYLRLGIEEQEREASKAKEQAELEAEALDLYNTAREEMAASTYGTYEQLDNHSRRKWLAVARRAREMRAEK